MQGQELTVRQMTLLGFRDLVLMKLSLGDLLCKNRSLIPASITQMLLVLQVNVNCKPMLKSDLYNHLYYSCLFLCMCREFRNQEALQRNIASLKVWWR